MTSLYIQDQPADLPASGAGVRLQYSIRNLQQFGSVRGDFSYTLTLPPTRQNNRIFGLLFHLETDLAQLPEPVPNPGELIPARLEAEGQTVLQGYVRVLAFSASGYEVQLLGGNANWGIRFQRKKLGDVDRTATDWRNNRWWRTFDACDFLTTNAHTGLAPSAFNGGTPDEIRASFQGACYPFISYNDDAYSLLPGTPLPFGNLRPATFAAPLLKAHFAEEGYRLESDWLEGLSQPTLAGPDPLILPFSLKDWIISSQLDENQLRARAHSTASGAYTNRLFNLASLAATDTDTASEIVSFTITETHTPPDGFGSQTLTSWKPRRPGWYRFSGQIVGSSPSGTLDGWALQIVKPDGSIFPAPASELYATGVSNATGTFDVKAEITPEMVATGAAVCLSTYGTPTQHRPEPGSFLEVRLLNQVVEGSEYDLRDTLPDLTVMDLLKALTAMFNLCFQTDPDRRTVRMEPRDAFLLTGGPELGPALDTATPIRQQLYGATLPRTFRFLYDQSDQDTLLSARNPTDTEAAITYGGYEIQNPVAIAADQVQETDVRKFVPALSERYSAAGIEVLAFRQEDFPSFNTAQPPRLVGVRQAEALVDLPVSYELPVTGCAVGALPGGTLNIRQYQQAYFDSFGRTLSFADSATASGLFSQHYYTFFHNLARARLLEFEVRTRHLPIAELTDFRRLQRLLQHRLQPVEVRNHQPGTHGSVTVQAVTQESLRLSPPALFARQYALSLDGVSQFGKASLAVGVEDQPFFISLWAKAVALPGSEAILAAHRSASGEGWALSLDSAGRLVLELKHGANVTRARSSGGIPAGAWHHLMVCRDGTDPFGWNFWIDATLQATDILLSGGVGLVTPAGELGLGADPNGDGSGFFHGLLSEFLLVRKRAGFADAYLLYNQGEGHFPPSLDALLAYYRLNQSYGPDAPDLGSDTLLKLQHFSSTELLPGGGAWVIF